MHPSKIIILGCGYIGTAFALAAKAKGIQVTAMVRSQQQYDVLHTLKIHTIKATSPEQFINILNNYDALLDSIPLQKTPTPHVSQDKWLPKIQQKIQHMKWIAYLSSSSVYGDHQGAWVNEDSQCQPSSLRGLQRLEAERMWQQAFKETRIFRLSGIYGPQRHLLPRLKEGKYNVLCWPHFSNRIHCDDIVNALMTSLKTPQHSPIINLSDDEPLSHHQYVCELAHQAGYAEPNLIPDEQAKQFFSHAYLDFFRDNKRIENKKLHRELLTTLKYPSFRNAVADLLKDQARHRII